MNSSYIFLILLVVGLDILIIAIILRAKLAKKKAKCEETGNLDAETLQAGCLYRNELNGQVFQYQFFEGSNRVPPHLEVYSSFDTPVSFKISNEIFSDRLFQKWGYGREIKTEDPEFDRRFYINCHHPEFLDDFFKTPERRRAVIDLIEMGFEPIEVSKNRLVLKKMPFSLKQPEFSHWIRDVAGKIKILTTDLPEFTPPVHPPGFISHATVSRFFIALSSVALVAAIAAWIVALARPPMDGWGLFFYTLRYSLPCFLLFLFGAGYLLKGKSDSHRIFATVFTLSLLAFLIGGMAYFMKINAAEDPSPIQFRRTMIVRKYFTRSKSSFFYHAKVDSWRPKQAFERLPLSESEFRTVVPGKTYMIVETKPGKLGFEWKVKHYLDDSDGVVLRW